MAPSDTPENEMLAPVAMPGPRIATSPSGGEFFSAFGINDNVEFRPMYRQQQALGIADEGREGRVVAVRFTEMKVWYDIFDLYIGTVFENVDSSKVYATSFVGLPQPQQVPEETEPIEPG